MNYGICWPAGWAMSESIPFMEINNYLSKKEVFEMPSEPFGMAHYEHSVKEGLNGKRHSNRSLA